MLRDTILTFDLAAVALCVVLIMLYMIGRSYPSKTNLVFFSHSVHDYVLRAVQLPFRV